MPALAAIPHGIWLALSAVEILCAVSLVLPALGRGLTPAAVVAAAVIGAEMLAFTAVAASSDAAKPGEVAYWLVVATLCAFLVYGRLVLTRA